MKVLKIRISDKIYDVTVSEINTEEVNKSTGANRIHAFSEMIKNIEYTKYKWIYMAILFGIASNVFIYIYLSCFDVRDLNMYFMNVFLLLYSLTVTVLLTYSWSKIIRTFLNKEMKLNEFIIVWICIFVSFMLINSSMNILDDYAYGIEEYNYYSELVDEGLLKSNSNDNFNWSLFNNEFDKINTGRKYSYFESSVNFENLVTEFRNYKKNEYLDSVYLLVGEYRNLKLTPDIKNDKLLPKGSLENYFRSIIEDGFYSLSVVVTIGIGQIQPQSTFLMILDSIYLLLSQILIIFGIAFVFRGFK